MYTRRQIANARKMTSSFGCKTLLSKINSNPKVMKNKKVGVLSAPLHLAPHKLSGYNVCPWASPGCVKACLHTAGNKAYQPAKNKARITRTKFFFEARREFFIILYADIARLQKRANHENMSPGVRLNATSDIPWERFELPDSNATLFETFPDTRMYDYTKSIKRMMEFLSGNFPDNYYLTFSASEDNWENCKRVLQLGGTVAVAFDIARNKPMVPEYRGFRVIDADTHDFRPNDPKGCIAGLRAKGEAINDVSGFVHSV